MPIISEFLDKCRKKWLQRKMLKRLKIVLERDKAESKYLGL